MWSSSFKTVRYKAVLCSIQWQRDRRSWYHSVRETGHKSEVLSHFYPNSLQGEEQFPSKPFGFTIPSLNNCYYLHISSTPRYLPTSSVKVPIPPHFGPGSSVGIATGYGLDRSGDRIPVAARFSAPVQTGPEAHPASCTMGTGSFPRVKSDRGVTLTPHPLLMPWSRKSNAISLLPLWAVRPVQSLSACRRAHFIFTFISPFYALGHIYVYVWIVPHH